jgi:hypothetical protein
MGNFALGFRVMFRVWSDAEFAGKVRDLAEGKLVPKTEPKTEPKPQPAPATAPKKESRRSEAVSLLAVLQREARFVDFVKEPISGYSDAQIGAAVRDVHKGCAAMLDRLFALQPVSAAAEGASVEVPRHFDPAQFRLIGNVTGEPPFRGMLQHHGWKAAKCELPEWTGSEASALVIAPAEVEVK